MTVRETGMLAYTGCLSRTRLTEINENPSRPKLFKTLLNLIKLLALRGRRREEPSGS